MSATKPVMTKRRQGGWIKNPWRCGVGSVRLRPFMDYTQGDARKSVWVSFYAAPELCIEVYVDSTLPLDLPDDERCSEKLCFRFVLDAFWQAWKEAWWTTKHGYEPPVTAYRRRELMAEVSEGYDETADALWAVIERAGCTWMPAQRHAEA